MYLENDEGKYNYTCSNVTLIQDVLYRNVLQHHLQYNDFAMKHFSSIYFLRLFRIKKIMRYI